MIKKPLEGGEGYGNRTYLFGIFSAVIIAISLRFIYDKLGDLVIK